LEKRKRGVIGESDREREKPSRKEGGRLKAKWNESEGTFVELDEELLSGLGRGGFLAGEIGGAGIGEIFVERHGGRVQNGVVGAEEERLGLFHRGWRRRGGTSGARPFGGERHEMEREKKREERE